MFVVCFTIDKGVDTTCVLHNYSVAICVWLLCIEGVLFVLCQEFTEGDDQE